MSTEGINKTSAAIMGALAFAVLGAILAGPLLTAYAEWKYPGDGGAYMGLMCAVPIGIVLGAALGALIGWKLAELTGTRR